MYIEIVPNRESKPTVLLRESRREGAKIIKTTIANLSRLSPDTIAALSIVFAGGKAIPPGEEPLAIHQNLPHGHVAAALGTMQTLKFDNLLGVKDSRIRKLIFAMVAMRLLEPISKQATAGMLSPESEANSLGRVLNLGDVHVNELCKALDFLYENQSKIEQKLARRHLSNGTLVLYDLSSSYFEGHCCKLAKRGYSRDGKKGTLQIVYGLLCNADGCPVAIEVFEGNTADSATLGSQIKKLRERYKLRHVVMVGDRGMITQPRIDEDLKPTGLDWITALQSNSIKKLIQEEAIQMSLFDEQDMATITPPDYPNERLLACRNPLLADRRKKKREDLLCATEKELDKIVQRTQKTSRALSGKEKIGLAVGKVIQKYKMAKHFELAITDESFFYCRKHEAIEKEALLDGIYVVRTSVPEEKINDKQAVMAYKSLAKVERAFRSIKTSQLEIRPIRHWNEQRVKGHAFLCMLAYYLEWHLRQKLAPMLYSETDHEAAEALRDSPVAKAGRSPTAKAKQNGKRTPDGLPVLSFKGLLAHLATFAWMKAAPATNKKHSFVMYSQPTPLQAKAFELLEINPKKLYPEKG